MFKSKFTLSCFALAFVALMFAIFLGTFFGYRGMVAGATPNGEGVATLLVSILSACGLSFAGIANAIWHKIFPGTTDGTGNQDSKLAEVIELTASFAALMKDRSNRASQRRFIFALVDAARLIAGVETSHEGGMVTIKYSGFVDPVVPSPTAKTLAS